MARQTIEIRGRAIPTIWIWVFVVALFVVVVPMVTFVVRERPWSTNPGAEVPAANPVRQAGLMYSVDPLFSMSSVDLASPLPRNDDPEVGRFAYLEVVAPVGDGTVWVVHHPPENGVVPHVRRFGRDGTVLASFDTTAGATLFTPGRNGELWVDVASGGGDQERAVRYSATGEVLDVFPLPAGLFARSLVLDPDGALWALAEEWSIDPETDEVSLQSALVPVAIGDPLEVPLDPAALVLDGAFWGADGLLYRVRSSGVIPEGTAAPAYEVTSWTKAGEQIAEYSLPADVRPFAADAQGRLYAEPLLMEDSISPGLSTLGDPAEETTTVWVVDREGHTTKVPVWRQDYYSRWAPSVWPTANGVLLTTMQAPGEVRVIELVPEGHVDLSAEEPFIPELTIIEPSEPMSGDPYAVTDDAQRDVMRLVYSGLVSFDASLQPVPDIAEAVPTKENGLVSGDGLTVTWQIREGITWHDGTPVTPEDVVATWRYLSENSYLPHGRPFVGFDAIEEVSAQGQTVVVRLSRPIGVAPVAFFPYVLPAHLLPTAPGANPVLFAAPVGCGPYRLARWEDARGWYLSAHDGASRSAGTVRSVHVVFAQGEAAQEAFESVSTPVVWDWVDEIRTTDLNANGRTVSEYPSGRWWGMVFDAASDSTGDERVREALKALYPRQTLVTQVYQSSETSVPVDAYPTASAAHDPDRAVSFGDDPEGARALFARSGWQARYHDQYARDVLTRGDTYLSVTGHHTHREWNDSEVPPDAADAIQMAWRAAGVLDSYDYASVRHYESWWRYGLLSFFDFEVGSGVFPSTIDPGWGGVFDPRDAPSVVNPYGVGITGTADPVLSALYAEAEAEYDPVRRAEIGREITKRAFDEIDLAIGERYEMRRIAVSGPVSGFGVNPLPSGAFSVVSAWRVGEAGQ